MVWLVNRQPQGTGRSVHLIQVHGISIRRESYSLEVEWDDGSPFSRLEEGSEGQTGVLPQGADQIVQMESRLGRWEQTVEAPELDMEEHGSLSWQEGSPS